MPRETPSIETPYSWIRLVVSIILSTLGCVGLWSLVVALPAVQADFGVHRAGASLPYTLTTLGFMIGGIVVGRWADRFGILPPFAAGTILMSVGYVVTAFAPTLPVFAVVSGVTIGLGSAASFAPLVADVSLWFDRHRGLAISLATAGSSLAGVVWPPVLQHFIAEVGWRQTHIGIGVFCLATMLPLGLVLRRRPVFGKPTVEAASTGSANQAIGLSPNVTHGLLTLAGLCCCVAMAMPQVHLVAYCVDLGYGPARGAEMLSLMLGFGVASRLIFGWVLNRIGGLPTLLAGLDHAGRCARPLSALRRADLALRHFRRLRPGAGRRRTELRGHHPRAVPGAGGRLSGQPRHLDHARRHGAGRLAGRRDLRLDRLLHARRWSMASPGT